MTEGRIQPGSKMDEAAKKLETAWRDYREAMKQEAPALLGGVIWVETADHDFMVYSESQRYTNRLKWAIQDIDNRPHD